MDPTFIKQIKQKSGGRSLNEFKSFVSNEEKKPLIGEEKTEKDSISTKKNLDEALKNLGDLEKSKERTKKDLEKIESFQKGIEEADAKLKKFEKNWMIGKFITGWKESTKLQKALTFLKIAITIAIPIAISVATATTVGLWVPLLVASLSIGLLYYFAKDVINIAKEKLTSALSEAYRKAMNFECKGIKDATKGITETVEKIKNGLYNCKNDLIKQATNIENLKSKIVELKGAIEEEKKNKEKEINECKDKINKQKKEIAEITNNLASTISSSLKNSAQVEEKVKSNISLVENAQKDIEVVQGTCDEITKDSQEIKNLSNGITNQIKNFNKKTVDKLKKFIEENNIEDQSKKEASEKKDNLEDKISKQKSDKLYSGTGFSDEKSEGSNETIKKLIDKISSSNVAPTKFAKLLTEIVNDQNIMNKAITESSTKISNLAEEIHNEHVGKVQDFCTKINNTLATVKANEKTLLDMQKTHKKELISNFQKILTENFLKGGDYQKLEALKEEFKDNKSFHKVFSFVFSKEKENQDFGEGEILVIKTIINKLQQSGTEIEEATKITNVLDILGNVDTIIKNINDINSKCKENISTIQDVEIKNIERDANKINESIEKLQKYSKKLKVETINKSAHIATASAGVIIGGTAVGLLGTTVGLPVTLAAGGAVLLGTALYKVIEHYKSDKN